MTSLTYEWVANLSYGLQSFSYHNKFITFFNISYPILLKLFVIGLSDFSASIEI